MLRFISGSTAGDSAESKNKGKLNLYIARHAERLDFTFGHCWWMACHDKEGNYFRANLNFPEKLPQREGGVKTFEGDTALTSMGLHEALLMGSGFKEKKIPITYCYSSCAIRCVQTANQMLEGCYMAKKIKIRVEPGLFEWLGWMKNARPRWMKGKEFVKNSFNVDLNYKAIVDECNLNWEESITQYYNRHGGVIEKIIENHRDEGGNVLIVAHASSLDTCSRKARGLVPRSYAEMTHLTAQVPYTSMVKLTKNENESSWQMTAPEFGVNVIHTGNMSKRVNVLDLLKQDL